MHPAAAFRETDEGLLVDLLERHPFATLFAAPEGRLLVAHAPVAVRHTEVGLALDFHLSRSNALSPFLSADLRILAVSLATEAYVSPDWYAAADQVPTWNYVSVEAEGAVALLDEPGLIRLLDDLSAREEDQLAPKPAWTRQKMSTGRFEAMLRGIVGARLMVERLEGSLKLSQNKSAADRAGVVAALGDHPLARFMTAL